MAETVGTLLCNGKAHPVTAGMTVASLVQALLHSSGVAVVEVNGVIIPPEQFDGTSLHDGDIVEVVHFVGGG